MKDFFREKAGRHEVTVARLIAECATAEGRNVPEILATAPPADIASFIHFLASGFAMNRTGKEGKTVIPKTIADTVALLEPIAPLLKDWPKGFARHVEDRLAKVDPAKNSAPARLGNWYQRLMQFSEPAYQPYREVVAQVIACSFDGSYVGALALTEHRNWLPAKQAATELGISAQRLVAAVLAKEIKGNLFRSGYGHQHTVVSVKQLQKISADRERYWDGRKAKAFLGVSRKQFDLLKEIAVISEVTKKDRPPLTDGGFDRQILESLVAKIRAHSKRRPGQIINFSDITLRRTTDRAALRQVFEHICGGRISPVHATKEMALSEFQFQRSEIEAELCRGRFSMNWTAQEVAKLTGCKPHCVVHWCQLGLLDARKRKHGPHVGYLITPEQLLRFQGQYTSVASLAKTLGTTSRKLISDLQKRGIYTHGAQNEGATSRGHLVKISDLV